MDTPAFEADSNTTTTNVLPENQLKLYLYFSAPMQNGDAWRHIHLLDQAGKPDAVPPLRLDSDEDRVLHAQAAKRREASLAERG